MQQPVDVLAKCLECIKHYFCVDLLKGKKNQTFKWLFNEFGATLSLNKHIGALMGGYFFSLLKDMLAVPPLTGEMCVR